ncbi:MAG: ABC transporter permease, partial [Armatimonadota bacterium]
MWRTIKELYEYRELLRMFVKRDLQVRYKGSVLGVLWSLLNPMLSVAVLWFVAKFVMDVRVGSITAYLAATYLPFQFFNTSIMDGAQSVLSNIAVLKKVYVPREIFTVSIVI